MNTLPILLVGAIALTIGDLVAGKWVENKSKVLYVLVLTFYMVGLCFLVFSYKFNDIAVASIIIEISNVILLTLIGRYLFKENITKTEVAGIITGVFAVTILEFS
jgi:multidrug transporter EmrE-like cation transporter